MTELTTPFIPSPLTSLEVPNNWFENHLAFGKWIDVFKHRPISFADILDYNFFLFEDFEIIFAFIESSPGKLLDSGSVSYPTLVKIFYYNLSFITVDGFLALRSYVKGQEIVVTKTLINELFKFSNVVDDSTPNFIAFQNAKDMFVLSSHLDFSPTRQLTHNGLTSLGKLLHNLIAKIVFSKGTSCELVSNCHLILIWKIAARKSIDYASLIISTMRFCSSSFRNLALPYANLLSLIFDHFNLITDLEEVDYSGPQSFSNNVLSSLGIFKVGGKYELYSNLSMTEKEELQKLHGKKIGRLEPYSKENQTTHSRLMSLDFKVCEIKVSFLELHDKVSTLTFYARHFYERHEGHGS